MPELFDEHGGFSETQLVHESARHALTERRKYARWLDSDDPVTVANATHLIVGRALNMLKSQIAAQVEAFEQALSASACTSSNLGMRSSHSSKVAVSPMRWMAR